MNAQNPPPQPGPGGRPGQQDNAKPQQNDPQDPQHGPDAAAGQDRPDVIGGPAADPLAEEGLPGAGEAASRIRRSVTPTFTSQGSSTLISSDSIGSINLFEQARLLAGRLPETELRKLRRVFQEPGDYREFKKQLRSERLIVLRGQPGTGRMYTALSLLDDLARGQVSRLDRGADLGRLDADQITDGHGYALEPASAGLPDETGLDRLCDLLSERQAYAVLLATPEPGDVLVRDSRYHVPHAPAMAAAVRDGHLVDQLADDPGLLDEARAVAAGPDVAEALGLDELRPKEAARLAALVAERVRGTLTHEDLLDRCRGFAEAQAAEWFATGARSETPEGLRDAAYRIAVSVLGGASLSAVAEAAETLAWELAVTVDPEAVPGRPLFSDGVDARLDSARAVAELGVEQVGYEDVPVRTVRFQGKGLAPAVLGHLWQHRHNVRGPVLRWLAGLCEDSRPQVWVRAAVAAGHLCRLDCSHTVHELVQPLAQAEQVRRRLFAATVLDEAAASREVGTAIRTLVVDWARRGGENLRWTAAEVLGQGNATATVRETLDLLGGIGVWEEGRLRVHAARQVAYCAGASCDAAAIRRIRTWMSDERRLQQDLGLQSAVFLAAVPVARLWTPHPDLEGYGAWPLILALADARPAWTTELAGLLWTAFQTPRSYDAALATVTDWLRDCAGQPWAEPLAEFLPSLVHGPDDRNRLLTLIKELAEDPDHPLDDQEVRRMWEAVQGAGTQ